MNINDPINKVPYIGDAYAKHLKRLNITSIKDLLYHIPTRLEDTTNIVNIKDIDSEEFYTIKGKIIEIKNIFTKYGKKLTKAIIQDDTGIADIMWFNQIYVVNNIPRLSNTMVYGKASLENGIRPTFFSPSYERIDTNKTLSLGKLLPVYAETQGVNSRWIRARIKYILKEIQITDWLNDDILKEYKLFSLAKALKSIHIPTSQEDYKKGIERIAFNEMLLIQLLIQEKRYMLRAEQAIPIKYNKEELDKYIKSLNFKLTDSQIKSINEILVSISKKVPMNRLLHGEVGSGKTVVAAAAIFKALVNNKKSAIMAPTTILANQHYKTLNNILKNLGYTEDTISLVTNKSKPKPEAKVFIGTQALLHNNEILKDISFAIIDEQHRFGVIQRDKIKGEEGKVIHSLTMTATPIPRTLALSVYGDLDISYISELPKGRQDITTKIVPEAKRKELYKFIKDQIDKGRQAFIVCPLIDLSDKLNLKSAIEEFELLQKDVFKDSKLTLLHGQMKSEEKDSILQDFKDKKFDILVSTPVVEVGIDIPNATIMLIEGAERFGLAQLHQLRGRVGRGKFKSYCFILPTNQSKTNIKRLKVFSENTSGLKIAEFDMQNRGPGEVYGVKQSGIPTLKAASLLDINLINKTRELAMRIKEENREKYVKIYHELAIFKQQIENLN